MITAIIITAIILWILIGLFDSVILWRHFLEKYDQIDAGDFIIILMASVTGPIGLFATCMTFSDLTIYKKK